MLTKISKWVVMKTKQSGTKQCVSPGLFFPGGFSVLNIRTQSFHFPMLPFRVDIATFSNLSFPFLWHCRNVYHFFFRGLCLPVWQSQEALCPISFLCVGRVVMRVATTFGNVTVFILFHVWLLLPKVGALSLGGLVPAKSHIKWHTLVCHLRTLIYIYKLHSWKINLIDFLFSKCLCQNEHKIVPHLPNP